jgi:hypothetical protein
MFSKYWGPGIVPPPNIFFCCASPTSRRLSSRNPFKLVALSARLSSLPSKPSSEEEVDERGKRCADLAYADPRRRTTAEMMARKMMRVRDRAV